MKAQSRQKGVKPVIPDENTAVSFAPPPAPPPNSWWATSSDEEFTARQRQRVQDAGWTSIRFGNLTR